MTNAVLRSVLALLVCITAALAPSAARADFGSAHHGGSLERRPGSEASATGLRRSTLTSTTRPASLRRTQTAVLRRNLLRPASTRTALVRVGGGGASDTASHETPSALPPPASHDSAPVASHTPGASGNNAVVTHAPVAAGAHAVDPIEAPRTLPATTNAARVARPVVRALPLRSRVLPGNGTQGRDGPRVGVLFDLDGTLVDSREAIFEASRAAAHESGWNLSEPELRQISSGAPFHTVIPAVRPGTTHEEMDRFIGFYTRHYETIGPARARMYPTAPQAFRALSAIDPKVQFGLATAQRTETSKAILERVGLASWFKTPSAIFGASGTNVPHKPAPDSLRLVAARLDLLSEDIAVYVGDMPNDIRAAHAAGMIAVAVNGSAHGYGDPAQIAETRPDYTVRDLSELPAVVRQIMADRAARQTPATTPPAAQQRPAGPQAALWTGIAPLQLAA